jgi:hypothetical protein
VASEFERNGIRPAGEKGYLQVPEAAATFNAFFGRLVETLANADERPR